MSDKSNQQISNLMDGELDANASKFLLKRMASDDSLSKTWAIYHLIKSCLQKQSDEPFMIDVASKVSEQLGLQKHQVIIPKTPTNRWLKPVLGFGIAASVAFMSVVMLQNQQIDPLQPIQTATIIAQQTNLNPIKPSISAKVVNAGRTLVPPKSLSRYPSLSKNNTYQLEHEMPQNMNLPYLIIINRSTQDKYLSPMRIKDISD